LRNLANKQKPTEKKLLGGGSNLKLETTNIGLSHTRPHLGLGRLKLKQR